MRDAVTVNTFKITGREAEYACARFVSTSPAALSGLGAAYSLRVLTACFIVMRTSAKFCGLRKNLSF